MDKILTSVKKVLGIESGYTHFDSDIILFINSALMSLNQLGIGPPTGFSILGIEESWVDLVGTSKNIESVKAFVYLKVRLLFDPPTSSFVLDSMERQMRELEWRLNVQVEKYIPKVVV